MGRSTALLSLSWILLAGCTVLQRGCYGDAVDPNVQSPDPPLPDQPCREQRRELALSEESEVGIPEDVVQWIDGTHTGTLLWTQPARRTQIVIDTWDPHAYFVKSTPAPDYVAANDSRICVNRLEITVQYTLATTDGRLQEGGALTLHAYGDLEAFGTLYFAWDGLTGSYESSQNGRCFQGLQIKVLLGDTGFSGSLADDYTEGNCDATTEGVRLWLAAGHWGARWQSF